MIPLDAAEEVALFAARRAVFTGAIGETLVRALQQLCQSKRQVVRDHAIRLAHIASSIAHNARTGDVA